MLDTWMSYVIGKIEFRVLRNTQKGRYNVCQTDRQKEREKLGARCVDKKIVGEIDKGNDIDTLSERYGV